MELCRCVWQENGGGKNKTRAVGRQGKPQKVWRSRSGLGILSIAMENSWRGLITG
jgi:hypothetical protein